jgi:hypothetical protein
MFKNTRVQMIAVLAIGGLLGYVAASGKLNPFSRADAAPLSEGSTSAGTQSDNAPKAACCDQLNKGQLLALADPKPKANLTTQANGKKPNIVVIMGDDVGIWNIRDELEAYLSLPYKEFDATPGSGHRRFRDQPRDPAQAGALIEAYLERHTDLPLNQRTNLQGHAAQLFAIGGMNQRAITHLDRLRAQNPNDNWANATKAFLLFDREGLLAARRRMANGEATDLVDYLIDHFGESYLDISRWTPICSTVRLPAGASASHRATADQLAQAFGPGFGRSRCPG